MSVSTLHSRSPQVACVLVQLMVTEASEDDHKYQGRLFWLSEFRDEVLARLLALNAERAAAERAAGVVPRSRRRAEELAELDEP